MDDLRLAAASHSTYSRVASGVRALLLDESTPNDHGGDHEREHVEDDTSDLCRHAYQYTVCGMRVKDEVGRAAELSAYSALGKTG